MYAKKSLGVECVRYFYASFVLVDFQIYKNFIAGLRPARIENPQLKRWGSGDPQRHFGDPQRHVGDSQQSVGLDAFSVYSHSSCFYLHLLSFLPSFAEVFRMKTEILNGKIQFSQSN